MMMMSLVIVRLIEEMNAFAARSTRGNDKFWPRNSSRKASAVGKFQFASQDLLSSLRTEKVSYFFCT